MRGYVWGVRGYMCVCGGKGIYVRVWQDVCEGVKGYV